MLFLHHIFYEVVASQVLLIASITRLQVVWYSIINNRNISLISFTSLAHNIFTEFERTSFRRNNIKNVVIAVGDVVVLKMILLRGTFGS